MGVGGGVGGAVLILLSDIHPRRSGLGFLGPKYPLHTGAEVGKVDRSVR